MLDEFASQLEGNAVVLLLVSPGVARPEQAVVHTVHVSGHLQVEAVIVLQRSLLDGAVQNSVDAGTGHGDIHALAHSVAATSPAGVQQVHLGAMAVELLTEQLGVHDGVHGHESSSETGGEVGHGLLNATLGSSDLGGVSAEEVVHGLLGGELGDGRQHAVGIAGEEDDSLGVTGHGVLLVVADVVDGVGHTTVLGLAHVVVVQTAVLLHHHVLEESVALDGVPNIGLLLLGEVDGLGVAASLEVEDTVVIPAVLVVSDQETLGVGGEGGLTGSGETEEQGAVAVLADVGGAVHGEDALQGKGVVHHSEDSLLHLTAVLGTDDEGEILLQIETDEGLAIQTLALPVLVHQTLAGVDHGEVGLEVGDLLGSLRAHEHVGHEVVLPSVLGHETDTLAALGVGSAVSVEHVHLLAVHVLLHVIVHLVEDLLGNGLVGRNGAPPDVGLAGLALHKVLVLGGTTSVNTSVNLESSSLGEHSLLVLLLVLGNLLVGEVAVDLRAVQTHLVQTQSSTGRLDGAREATEHDLVSTR